VLEEHIHIDLSIYEIYIVPLKGNYSEALPAQARVKIEVLRRLLNDLDKFHGRERSYSCINDAHITWSPLAGMHITILLLIIKHLKTVVI